MSERRGTKGLELWCRKMTEGYPGVKIDNMTTSWRNGLAFCAIIHHFRPDLIDFEQLNKDDIYHNNELAFRVAEHHLGIPALLEPEDMVEYTVPDRLSILTYLSQFYQTFAVRQGSTSARIAPKRPQTSPDHGIVSPASTSPPTKVAFTGAGKIRREPCAKCGLPVFIAERLNVGKLLFHRTCFCCARCNSQLTLANYYETENSEYCCEICPDEETLMSKSSPEKLLLQRSLSDEEKSATLKTFTSEPDDYSALFETALESVSDKELTLTSEASQFTIARSHFFHSQIESSGSEHEEEPPDLPKTVPPSLSKSDTTDLNDLVVNKSAHSDSGFPNNRLDDVVNYSSKVSVSNQYNSSTELDQTHNIVTKDKSDEEGGNSLVKARMRLFENNESTYKELRKSDVNRKSQNTENIPKTQTKSSGTCIPIVKLEDLENFDDQLAKNNNSVISDNKIIVNTNAITSPSEGNSFKHTVDVIVDKSSVEDQLSRAGSFITPLKQSNSKDSTMNKYIVKDPTKNFDKITNEQAVTVLNKINSEPSSSNYFENKETDIDTKTQIPTNSEPKQPSVVELAQISKDVMDDKDDKSSENIPSHFDNSSRNMEHNPPVPENERNDGLPSKLVTRSSSCSSPILKNITDQSKVEIAQNNEDQKQTEVTLDSSEEIEHSGSIIEISSQKAVTEESWSDDHDVVNTNAPLDSSEESKNSVITVEDSSPDTRNKDSFAPVEVIQISDSSSDGAHFSPEINVETLCKAPSGQETKEYPDDLNPFGDDEEEVIKSPEQSMNPFGSDDDEEEEDNVVPKKPTPSPRMKKKILPVELGNDTPIKIYVERVSVNPFESDDESIHPMPATRKKKVIAAPRISLSPLWNDDNENKDHPVKLPVAHPRISKTSTVVPEPKQRESGVTSLSTSNFGSNSSLSSGSAYGSARKRKPAPRPPIPFKNDDSAANSLTSSPSHSVPHSPKSNQKYRKMRRAPPPPTSTPVPAHKEIDNNIINIPATLSPVQTTGEETNLGHMNPKENYTLENVEQEKIDKDEKNRNRQSQNIHLQSPTSSENSSSLSAPNKSTYGQWKRRKGQAPKRPIPQVRVIKCLPMTEIRRELELIEIQQQGLEKQGVRLEQIIREKCEGPGVDGTTNPDDDIPIDVEDLILQLFELVNEKNELFRKQAELMYLRRQQRLEQEYADVEYQIRCLMIQPEANKTDSDKAQEEELIKRLVDIVERRNEIIDCLEMDRVREAEEDDSINSHINLYTLKRDSDKSESEKSKKEKDKDKEKKKHKKEKKSKNKTKDKVDIDKDIDESEPCATLEKKKKKKFNLF